jgi:hypothetical protein
MSFWLEDGAAIETKAGGPMTLEFSPQKLFRQDLRELLGYLSAKGTGATNNKKIDHHRKRDGTFASKHKKSKPLSISFLNFAWGVNKNYANRLVNQKPPEPTKVTPR